MGYIYKIVNQINGKIYIGQTIRSVSLRFKEHLKLATLEKNKKSLLYKAIVKYGKENFIVQTVEECDNNALDEREKYWISFYNSFLGDGYNATSGGEGGVRVNYEKICREYFRLGGTGKVRKFLGHDPETIRIALKSIGVQIKKGGKPSRDYNYILNLFKQYLSVKKVREKTGYDVHTIIKAIKTKTGMTPADYKKIIQKEDSESDRLIRIICCIQDGVRIWNKIFVNVYGAYKKKR